MKYLHLTISFYLLIFISSCDKPDYPPNSCTSYCFNITGNVIDFNNQINIPNLKIQLFIMQFNTFPKAKLLSETKTNKNGTYSFNIPSDEIFNDYSFIKVKAVVEGTDYNDLELSNQISIHNIDSLILDTITIANLNMFTKADLNLNFNIKKSGITEFSHSYKFNKTNYDSGNTYYKLSSPFSIDTIFSTNGDQYTFIKYEYDLNGTHMEILDSIYISGGKTGVYKVDI